MTAPNLKQIIAEFIASQAGISVEEAMPQARDLVAAIRDSGYTVIATPTIDHLGPDRTVADMYAGAAWKLDNGYELGGSNVKASIARTLRAIAAQHAGDTQ
ncbi:hypothetical protein E7939_21825 [Salmonella enterica]|nr:hypothetical protein [Salmonella enterica]EAT8036369.1 hypothetical protein [Salmonella enterica]EAV6370511.1 hypothetical protein [Salmonella enterica]